MGDSAKQSGVIASIPARLERLRESSRSRHVFGADSHQFRVHPRLSAKAIAGFEHRYGITLPLDYREFLWRVGNGGAGPDYGVYRLGCSDDDKPWLPEDWLIGELAAPFPHTSEWNPIPFDVETDDPSDELLGKIEEEYFSLKHVSGAIPICQRGCNLRFWLVVSGNEAGNIWFDRRVEWRGFSPVQTSQANRVTFVDWYCQWLTEAEGKAGIHVAN